ncbi:MAG: hypothetical protein A2747_03230 [Candidatus Yonathbacteria bacterium RIFCSPHIGHO2_01_FULL_44_41]|uniref:DUF3135 domain-containing protein n=1 Tax=Candidatus Yonathbacteria bacterium RIFCSPHIGHO2_02_FULL_44_14 TaxID=1802724 RepID=A0A1G2S7E5_9BACT|nr:MAG: hypothetical protein A2747_03230 [Candidatus Yonathbacteria bacterium RIFCSPHIGHO2_01_FULL_44_41]OHA80619.1 MAG: hypothetical protein A3D51_00170 [Candidatus Yonathbacteria bacterium RIFCSPHIGHO2_02_FULL_44_14]OHA82248.1 MAG: hypothetical protein A3B06_01835 [Candidatus Yonathbacteria bacterium RIFCSPLOWO2_01_FULL_43_20]
MFDYRAHLAKTDPERFEAEREAEIEKVILSANPERQQELRQLQWRIDMERRRAKNPIDAMVRLQKMMWRQFYADDGFVFAVNQMVKVCHSTKELLETLEPKNAVILPFEKD